MAFRLSESDCGQRLDRVCRQFKGTAFTDTNGIRQVQFTGEPDRTVLGVLGSVLWRGEMTRLDLSQWITVDRSVARSVNLERDAVDIRLLERYQVTPNRM